MKDFDEFRSWIEFEKNYYKSYRKHPVFDNEYLWIKDKKLLACGFFFYYSYYHYGIEFLQKKAEETNYPQKGKNTIIQLISLCQDFIHDVNMDFYEEEIFSIS